MTVLALVLSALAVAAYLAAVRRSRQRGWPRRRSIAWVGGVVAATLAVTGPMAAAAHHSFLAHMIGHLLLGMLAPLLLVVGAPVTLALRTLPVRQARRLSRVLSRPGIRWLTEPAVAATLNVGGLWVLYAGGLYGELHHRPVVHLMVHVHVIGAGYLLTQSLVGVDPMPHRRSFPHRAVVLVLAVAGHDILAKFLYAHPPYGVPDAAPGAMLMYYGGDALSILLMVLLCARWFRPRWRKNAGRLHESVA